MRMTVKKSGIEGWFGDLCPRSVSISPLLATPPSLLLLLMIIVMTPMMTLRVMLVMMMSMMISHSPSLLIPFLHHFAPS